MARPIASVIISAKNEAPRLEGCIASLLAQKSKFSFEVHIVDNGSTDGTYALARRLLKEKENFFVWREKKPGSPAARNHGARKARGDVLLFTDADCTFSPRWVEEMCKPLLSSTHYPLAAVGGFTESAFRDQKSPNLWERYLHDLFEFWEHDRLEDFPAFLPWAPTCNLAVKKDVFQALKGFDEGWISAAYDIDFCWRLVLCGFVIGHAAKAKLKHQRRNTFRGLLRQIQNYAYFNQSLLSTYQRELKLPFLGTQKERFLGRVRRAASLMQKTRSLSEAQLRGVDGLATIAAITGLLEAKVTGTRANFKLSSTRRGITPPSIVQQLSRGYSHLHNEGWVYWKSPPETGTEGELVLFRPRTSERFRFNETAWKIWEVKSEKGQSEDAAEVLGQSSEDRTVLHDIDEITMDFRTRRLLP